MARPSSLPPNKLHYLGYAEVLSGVLDNGGIESGGVWLDVYSRRRYLNAFMDWPGRICSGLRSESNNGMGRVAEVLDIVRRVDALLERDQISLQWLGDPGRRRFR